MSDNMKKRILILGGSSDIAESLVAKINEKKYDVFLHYNSNKPKIKNKKIRLIKQNFIALSNPKIKNILKKFKNFEIIINLLGYIDNKTYKNATYNDIIKNFNINFFAPYFIIRNSLNYMNQKKFGRIINCSSIGIKFGGGENTFCYSLSKHCTEFIPKILRNIIKDSFGFFHSSFATKSAGKLSTRSS